MTLTILFGHLHEASILCELSLARSSTDGSQGIDDYEQLDQPLSANDIFETMERGWEEFKEKARAKRSSQATASGADTNLSEKSDLLVDRDLHRGASSGASFVTNPTVPSSTVENEVVERVRKEFKEKERTKWFSEETTSRADDDISGLPSVIAAKEDAERVCLEFKEKERAKLFSKKTASGAEKEKISKYEQRLKMNRASAAAARVRREAYVKSLEQQLLLEHEKSQRNLKQSKLSKQALLDASKEPTREGAELSVHSTFGSEGNVSLNVRRCFDVPFFSTCSDPNFALENMFLNAQFDNIFGLTLAHLSNAAPALEYSGLEDEIPLSRYLELHKEAEQQWKNALLSPLLDFKQYEEQNRTEMVDGRLVVSKLISDDDDSFFLVMNDFLLAYDSSSEMVAVMIPLSKLLLFTTTLPSLNALIEDIPIRQVYFLARRLVQLTGACWKFDCLSQAESSLTNAKNRVRQVTNLYAGSEIDLDVPALEFLTGCDVYQIRRPEPCFHSVAIEMSGTLFGLRRHPDGIAKPEKLSASSHERLEKRINSYLIDIYQVSIGGKHSRNNMPGVKQRRRSDTTPVYNLGFIPQNQLFEEQRTKLLRVDDGSIEAAFVKLGYGEHLSKLLAKHAAVDRAWDSSEPRSIESVQRAMIYDWRDQSESSMVYLSLTNHMAIPRGTRFLVLSGNRIKLAKASRKITTNLVVGAGIPPMTLAAGVSSSPLDLYIFDDVSYFLDAVTHLTSKYDHSFAKRPEGDYWVVDAEGMREQSAAILFLSVMLAGKVLPEGVFKECVPTKRYAKNGQTVNFNIPISYGIAYSTFACGMESTQQTDVRLLYKIGEYKWNTSLNYKRPAVMCDDKCDQHLSIKEELSKCEFEEVQHQQRPRRLTCQVERRCEVFKNVFARGGLRRTN